MTHLELDPEIAALAAWMQDARRKYAFADLHITVKLHDSVVKMAERSITERCTPAELRGGHNGTQRR